MSTTAAEPEADTGMRGWRRHDGRIGIRDHFVVLSTLALTNRWAQHIVAQVPGALLVAGDLMRGLQAPDLKLQAHVIDAVVRHPNVGRALVLAHDEDGAAALRALWRDAGKPVQVLAFMRQQGVARAVDAGVTAARALQQAPADPVVGLGWGDLGLALECGGSDPTSGMAANAVIGRVVDRVVDAGGFAIVSETAELVGAEDALRARSVDARAAGDILQAVAARERQMREDGQDYRGINPTPENLEAGLTTLVEKSLGALAKTGSRGFQGLLPFAQPPSAPGLYVMDTPFFSPVSITGMVAAGATLTLFGIGVFNPSGCPLAPTVKVCGNPATARTWTDMVDVDVSAMLDGSLTLDGAAQSLARTVRAVASGTLTHTEHWGEGQVMVPKTLPAL
jgi:altronate dehydratase large subunit